MFITPTFDELDEIAFDPTINKNKRLNREQLESIKKTGQFDVDSLHFPGKKHTWVLTKLLQDGYENSNKIFYQTLSTALHLLIVTSKRRFNHRVFSIWQSLKAWGTGFKDLVGKHLKITNFEFKNLTLFFYCTRRFDWTSSSQSQIF